MLTLRSTREVIAMGVHCRIEVTAPDAPLQIDSSIQLLNELEDLWSRFIPTSDISRINEADGKTISVDSRTVSLIAAMKEANAVTKGSFNPCQLPTQIALGDAQSLQTAGATVLRADSVVFNSLTEIGFIDHRTVSLPRHMTLDAGGIAKGYAADLIAQQALESGATHVSVNLGGDIRVAQKDSATFDTPVDVMHPLRSHDVLSTVSLRQGAIATSARNARWRNGQGIHNHIMGANTDIVGASVISSSAMWADVWTKHLILSSHGLADANASGLAGLIVWSDGSVEKSENWKDFEQC